jgi:hypothetical protein
VWGALVAASCIGLVACSSVASHSPARDRVTFVPASAVSASELGRSAAVLRTRLAHAHVRGASVAVTTFGSLLVLAPRTAATTLINLGRPDLLEMRPMLAETVVTGGSCRPGPASGAGYPPGTVLGCSPDGTAEYALGGLALDSSGIASARARRDPISRTWKVQLTCTKAGAASVAATTARLSGDRLAITVDGTVIASPVVAGAITGRVVEITAAYDAAQAEQLVALVAGGTLPVAFHRAPAAPGQQPSPSP